MAASKRITVYYKACLIDEVTQTKLHYQTTGTLYTVL